MSAKKTIEFLSRDLSFFSNFSTEWIAGKYNWLDCSQDSFMIFSVLWIFKFLATDFSEITG
jgi:hypothetical protein